MMIGYQRAKLAKRNRKKMYYYTGQWLPKVCPSKPGQDKALDQTTHVIVTVGNTA